MRLRLAARPTGLLEPRARARTGGRCGRATSSIVPGPAALRPRVLDAVRALRRRDPGPHRRGGPARRPLPRARRRGRGDARARRRRMRTSARERARPARRRSRRRAAAERPSPPRSTRATTHCASCRMAVSDARFAAQIVGARARSRASSTTSAASRDYLKAGKAPGRARSPSSPTTGRRPGSAATAPSTRGSPASQTPMGSHVIAHADAASRDADPDARRERRPPRSCSAGEAATGGAR